MQLVGLPANLIAASVTIAGIVASLLASFTPVVAKLPGLRPTDSTRNVLMRVLVAVLNLALLLAYAWQSNTVIEKGAIPALLAATGFFGVLGGHYVYKGVQSGVQQLSGIGSGSTTTTILQPGAVEQEQHVDIQPDAPPLSFNRPDPPPAEVGVAPAPAGTDDNASA